MPIMTRVLDAGGIEQGTCKLVRHWQAGAGFARTRELRGTRGDQAGNGTIIGVSVLERRALDSTDKSWPDMCRYTAAPFASSVYMRRASHVAFAGA